MTIDFEDRLLAELKREVVRASAEEPSPAPRRVRGFTPGHFAVGLTGATAAAAAVLVLPGGGAGPAYAVESDGAGGVEVRLTDWPRGAEEIEAFRADLAAAGVSSVYNPPAGYHCQPFPDGVFVQALRIELEQVSPELEEHLAHHPAGGAPLLTPVAQDRPDAPGASPVAYVRGGDTEFAEDATYRLHRGDTVLLVDEPTYGSIAFVDGACAEAPVS
ncbi:hypothetical protein SAMN06297387_101248 [Streptomyces zhaozhouensis]|uniref:Uncharacterized protein n=1 Tax=Streptomyces zhaozhouensis TaxID=1300267 RepID=A0A286DIT1_9ACTN|nr:hypothetical protein [Streptomyces zhaozhouensis]SOD58637.1 hypothetical protein SAMN06297387_101248 [Streptomyces zhaozhouensis]